MKKYYKYFHTLSLDVATGSVIMAMVIASLLDNTISVEVYALLFLIVWGLYLTDHVLDAQSQRRSTEHPRLGVILHNFSWIKWVLGLISIAIFCLLFFVPIAIVKAGAFLGAIVIIYFLLFHFTPFSSKLTSFKEPIIALVYAIGVCLPAFSQQSYFFEDWKIIVMVFCIAFQNLLLFAVSEQDWDQLLDQSSLIGNLGRKNLVGGFYVINFVSYPLIYFFTLEFGLIPMITFLMMNLWIAISFLVLLMDDNYWGSRMMGDATFIIPVILLYFAF